MTSAASAARPGSASLFIIVPVESISVAEGVGKSRYLTGVVLHALDDAGINVGIRLLRRGDVGLSKNRLRPSNLGNNDLLSCSIGYLEWGFKP